MNNSSLPEEETYELLLVIDWEYTVQSHREPTQLTNRFGLVDGLF